MMVLSLLCWLCLRLLRLCLRFGSAAVAVAVADGVDDFDFAGKRSPTSICDSTDHVRHEAKVVPVNAEKYCRCLQL